MWNNNSTNTNSNNHHQDMTDNSAPQKILEELKREQENKTEAAAATGVRKPMFPAAAATKVPSIVSSITPLQLLLLQQQQQQQQLYSNHQLNRHRFPNKNAYRLLSVLNNNNATLMQQNELLRQALVQQSAVQENLLLQQRLLQEQQQKQYQQLLPDKQQQKLSGSTVGSCGTGTFSPSNSSIIDAAMQTSFLNVQQELQKSVQAFREPQAPKPSSVSPTPEQNSNSSSSTDVASKVLLRQNDHRFPARQFIGHDISASSAGMTTTRKLLRKESPLETQVRAETGLAVLDPNRHAHSGAKQQQKKLENYQTSTVGATKIYSNNNDGGYEGGNWEQSKMAQPRLLPEQQQQLQTPSPSHPLSLVLRESYQSIIDAAMREVTKLQARASDGAVAAADPPQKKSRNEETSRSNNTANITAHQIPEGRSRLSPWAKRKLMRLVEKDGDDGKSNNQNGAGGMDKYQRMFYLDVLASSPLDDNRKRRRTRVNRAATTQTKSSSTSSSSTTTTTKARKRSPKKTKSGRQHGRPLRSNATIYTPFSYLYQNEWNDRLAKLFSYCPAEELLDLADEDIPLEHSVEQEMVCHGEWNEILDDKLMDEAGAVLASLGDDDDEER